MYIPHFFISLLHASFVLLAVRVGLIDHDKRATAWEGLKLRLAKKLTERNCTSGFNAGGDAKKEPKHTEDAKLAYYWFNLRWVSTKSTWQTKWIDDRKENTQVRMSNLVRIFRKIAFHFKQPIDSKEECTYIHIKKKTDVSLQQKKEIKWAPQAFIRQIVSKCVACLSVNSFNCQDWLKHATHYDSELNVKPQSC